MMPVFTMKTNVSLVGAFILAASASAANFGISSLDKDGHLSWSNAFSAGVVTVETQGALAGPWLPGTNYFTSNSVGSARLALAPGNGFVRLLSVDISTNT